MITCVTMKTNRKLKQWFLAVVLMAVSFSCTEEFDLKLHKNEQKLAVQGWITDKPGPYLIRLTLSAPEIGYQAENSFGYPKNTNTSVEAVKGALVIISDNAGIIDTLRQRLPQHAGDEAYTIEEGYYETSKLQGKAGRTYHLTIKVNGKEYAASTYMPAVATIEEVSSIYKKDPFKNNEFQLVPTVTFQEPQATRDYYLFNLGQGNDDWGPILFGGSNRHWNVSVVSDAALPAYVKNYSVDGGVAPSGMDFYYYRSGEEVRVNMYSLTPEAYKYFKALVTQFNNDGGAYQPAPASPPTNISGGAVGFFGASAVSSKVGVMK